MLSGGDTVTTMTKKHGRHLLQAWIVRGKSTQAQAAADLGLKLAQLSKYLTGRQMPTLQKALVIQRVAHIPVESWWDDSASKARNARKVGANPANVSSPDMEMSAG